MNYELKPYLALIDALLEGRLSIDDFQSILLPLFKRDPLQRPQEIYDPLNDLFVAAETYDAEFPLPPGFATEAEELLSVARVSKSRLEAVRN